MPALECALACGRPACVNVMTDSDVISPVTVAMVGDAAKADADTRVTIPYYDDLE